MKKVDTVALGIILTHLTGEFHDQITVALYKFMRLTEYLRSFLFEPEQFRCHIGRQKIITRYPKNLVCSDFFSDPFANMPRSRVHPDRCIM